MRGWGAFATTALGSVFLAMAPLWVAPGEEPKFWLLRLVAVATLGIVVFNAVAKPTPYPLIVSPAFLLPANAIMFYAVLPAVFIGFEIGPPILIPEGSDPLVLREIRSLLKYLVYVPASAGELMVLSASGMFLFLAQAFDRAMPPMAVRTQQRVLPWAVIILMAGIVFHAARMAAGAYGWAQPAADLLVPVILFGMSVVVLNLARLDRLGKVLAVAALIGGALLLTPYHVKLVAFFAACSLLLGLVRAQAKTRMAMMCVLLVAPILGAMAAGLARGSLTQFDLSSIAGTLRHKIIYRQGETLFCLNFSTREGMLSGAQSPGYFMAALVPRVVWPDKPSLSLGVNYSFRFCGIPHPELSGHSGSITLLGEPVLRAGWGGGLAAGAVAALVLAGALWAWRLGGMTAALSLALSPWLLDFDQDFALYLALVVKGALIMAVTLFMGSRFFPTLLGSEPRLQSE